MRKPYFHYVGHLLALKHANMNDPNTLHFLEDLWRQQIVNESFFESVDNYLERSIHLLHHQEEIIGDDRILEHAIDVSSEQINMWMESVEITLSKFYENAQLDDILGKSIHCKIEFLTTVAQAVKLIELLRISPNLIEQLGGRQQTRDVINCGWTLLARLFKATKPLYTDALSQEHYQTLHQMFENLDNICRNADQNDLTRLVFAGFVPLGRGLPVGGSGYNILLHKCAQGPAPDLSSRTPTSGWSIGRAGNKENLGKGRLTKTYE